MALASLVRGTGQKWRKSQRTQKRPTKRAPDASLALSAGNASRWAASNGKLLDRSEKIVIKIMSDQEIVRLINTIVKESIPKLQPHLRSWAETHLVSPKLIDLSKNENGEGVIKLWLVTDHIGENDSSSRVVFDAEKGSFGLVMTMANGVNWFMGLYGDFAETVEAI